MGILNSLSTADWTPFGPSPIDAPGVGLGRAAGRVDATAPHPSNANTVYAAVNNGGIWKTSGWASNPPQWFALGDAQASMQIGGYHPLIVHPANHSLVFGVVGYHGAGVLKSVNAGISWILLGNSFFDGAAINSIAVDPADVNVIYVGVASGGPGGGVYLYM